MRIKVGKAVLGLLVGVLVAGGPVTAMASNNSQGLVFRAIGWFKGEEEITSGQIRCEIPTTDGAISEGSFVYGLWNTYGVQSLFYPDRNHPFANPCGGWIQLRNNLALSGITVERVQLRYRIRGAGRFRQFVPTRRGWPIACRDFRKEQLFVGNYLNAAASSASSSGSGAPNVAFIQMLPMVSPQLLHCLRAEYAGLSTDLFVSLPVVIKARAIGISDSGDRYVSNTVGYTLTLRHTCGNGRVDDGESCDPMATGNTCLGICDNGACSFDENFPCSTNADCSGTCIAPDNPSECTCIYGVAPISSR